MNKTTTVLLVEDHKLLRMGLRVALEDTGCCIIVGEAGNGEDAVKEAHRLRPDVILMDVGLPGMDGIEATWLIKQELPRTRVIIFTSHTEPKSVSAAFGAGADGFCTKETPAPQIVLAIAAVNRGETWLDPEIADVVVQSQTNDTGIGITLSKNELDILGMIREQLNNLEIANRLNTNPETIEKVVFNIISRFVQKKDEVNVTSEKQRGQLNEWLTAFVANMDKGSIFDEKYLIEGLIGAGGIGTVYKAKHLYIEREVALKLLHPEMAEDRVIMRSFQREATAIANIHHKNIVGLYDFGISARRQPFLIMEYVQGSNLSDILDEEQRLDTARAVNLTIQICEGLAAAHSKGIVHCDLKPNNILILKSGSKEEVKLVDFGLVQLMPRDSAAPSQMTEKYVICGSPRYMPPEQCAGKAIDERSDIYALGCVLFECLTGESVFDGDTAMEIFAKQLQTKAPLLSEVYPAASFSIDIETLVAKMLSKDPRARPQSMNEVKSSLEKLVDVHSTPQR